MFVLLKKWLGGFNSSSLHQTQKIEKMILESLGNVIPAGLQNEDVIFLCIGTHMVSGDSFGPLVGSFLQKNGYQNVCGTIDSPVDAKNMEEKLKGLPHDKKVIAIDAALGEYSAMKTYSIISGPIYPGTAGGKNLPSVGDFGIMAVVNVKDWRTDTLILSSTPISTLVTMVTPLAMALMKRFPVGQSTGMCNIFEEDLEIKSFVKQMQKDSYCLLFH